MTEQDSSRAWFDAHDVRAVLVDWDGTLVDSEDANLQAMRRTLATVGLSSDDTVPTANSRGMAARRPTAGGGLDQRRGSGRSAAVERDPFWPAG